MDGSVALQGQVCREPYRATKLWLESIAIFRTGIPLGKNRYRFKSYENCFVASEAINWFHTQLQGTFKSEISRTQTLHLLRKFYKAGIFIPVSQKEQQQQSAAPIVSKIGIIDNSNGINENEFRDNGQLYKLSGWNVADEIQKVQEATGTGMDSDPPAPGPKNYTVVVKLLEPMEVWNIWKNVFIERLVQVHGSDILEFIPPSTLIHGDRIEYNMTKISQFGIVINAKGPEEDLPSWLIHAMKCLANWPNNHILDQSTPSYPGFENDVFKLILDYFEPLKTNGNPLLTPELYDAFITAFIRAELFDFKCRLYNNQSQRPNKPQRHCSLTNRDEKFPLNYSDSLENLLLEILTPANEREQKNCKPVTSSSFAQLMGLKPRRIFGATPTQAQENCLLSPEAPIVTVPSPMPQKTYDLSRYSGAGTNAAGPAPVGPIFYETAFTSQRTPITRLVSRTELQQSTSSSCFAATTATTTPQRPSSSTSGYGSTCTYAYENPVLQLSPPDLINHPKYSKVSQKLGTGQGAPLIEASTSFLNYSTAILPEPKTTLKKNLSSISRSYSASHLSDQGKDRSPYQPQPQRQPGPVAAPLIGRGIRAGKSQPKTQLQQALRSFSYANSPSRSARKTLDFYYGADACVPGLMTQEGKNLAIMSFRLLTLLLPPQNRRHLQLLLRCMTKMVRNEKLMLDVGMTTRAIVINSFYRAILYPTNPSEFDELLALRIVTFLVDNDKEIFNLGDEKEWIAGKVDELVKEQQIQKIPDADPEIGTEEGKENKNLIGLTTAPASACKRITLDEYEEEKLLGSTSKSLRQLLDTIDGLDDEKLRKKKLRDFRNEYPHIYSDKFGPNSPAPGSGDTSITTRKRESKPEWKAFRLFKSLRM